MKKALLISIMLIVIAGMFFVACSNEDEEPSIAITSLRAIPATITAGATSNISAEVDYTGDEAISYAWSCTGGNISGAGSSVTWIAPDATGNFSINLTATDGVVSDDGSVIVQVNDPGDDTLRITAITAEPAIVQPGGSSSINATVFYIGSGSVAYDWECSGGNIVGSGTSVSWNAPATEGTYAIGLSATDGDHSAYKSVLIEVREATGLANIEITPDKTIMEEGQYKQLNSICYDSNGVAITCPEVIWSTTASNISVDSLTGIVYAEYDRTTASNVRATTYINDSIPIFDLAEVYVVNELPEIIVVDKQMVELCEGDFDIVDVYAASEDSTEIYLPPGIEWEITKDCDNSIATASLLSGNLNITGVGYGTCTVTIILHLTDEDISTYVDVMVIEMVEVSGTVRNAQTGNPVAGAEVTIERTASDVSTTTNSSGVYSFTDANRIPVGETNLTIEKERFFDTEEVIDIVSGGVTSLDFYIEPCTTWIEGYVQEVSSGGGLNNIHLWLSGHSDVDCTTHTIFDGTTYRNGYYKVPSFLETGTYYLNTDRRDEFQPYSIPINLNLGMLNTIDTVDLIWNGDSTDWVYQSYPLSYWEIEEETNGTRNFPITEPAAVMMQVHFDSLSTWQHIGYTDYYLVHILNSSDSSNLQTWINSITFDEWSYNLPTNSIVVQFADCHAPFAGGFSMDQYRYVPIE